MPLYEYECTSCHRRTEKIQKFSDPELTICPHCGGPLERTITAAAVSFKGGGWYKDGYASAKPSTPSGEGSGSGDSSASDSSAGKSDSSASKVESVSASASSGDTAKSSESPKQAAPAATPSAPAKA